MTPSIMYVTVSNPRCGCHGVPFGSPRGVVDLTDLIEVHERVEHREVDPGEARRTEESLALVPLWCDGDGADRTLEAAWVGGAKAGEHCRVVDRDGGHETSCVFRRVRVTRSTAVPAAGYMLPDSTMSRHSGTRPASRSSRLASVTSAIAASASS